MSSLKKLFQQTFIYGLATVLPRMLSFLLVPLYTDVLPVREYGEFSIIISWIVLFNVLLAYGMETAFFRFFHKEKDKGLVVSTAALSIIFTSVLFFVLAFLLSSQLSDLSGIREDYIHYTLFILLLDALVIIPFAWLRANEKPVKYAIIKILNVAVNLGLNVFLLLFLPKMAAGNSGGIVAEMYVPDFEISYIFISMIIASSITLLMVISFYTKVGYSFSTALWTRMMRYAYPVLIAGVAFAINETFDRILLDWFLPENIAEEAVGAYAACYKLAIFMTLFATAFRMGIEPFFFSHAGEKNAQKTYALITRYFVAFGSVILVTVVVFADFLKILLIRNSDYWEAMKIVPLILLANFCLGIYHNLSVWYKVTDRTRFGAFISVGGAIITLAVNFLLIPTMSYMGSAIATVGAYGTMMILSYYFGQKYYPIPYDLRKIGLYLTGSVLISGISFYIFPNNYLIGISLWLAFLTLVFLQEKTAVKQLIFKR
ncbi:oligosaccharide flippase family protein [Antarcticibacterium arcticum]|uniref:Oligosaccharide flippase family protein n=1 Tax=Antarcticibacterium arcticum TaxID=2585771 RepID=A0A5B8YR37_9FLAO|nr:oligosaccharide flippase family protein [Antarcticibacterium arcticum]QED38499.1 oligosaccharide flippase family protein [Antarcticibacterium arcticum]